MGAAGRHGPELALFDFDGTLTRKDTSAAFLCYAVGAWRFYSSLLALFPAFVGYITGHVAPEELKIRILTRLVGGWSAARYRALADSFARTHLPNLLRASAVARLRWHRARGDRVIVVSASLKEWVEPFCREYGVESLCTEVEVVAGRLTGRLAGPNCSGSEKVRRLRGYVDLTGYEVIHAYGNSRADRQMLAIAHHAWYRRFPAGDR